MYLVAIIDWHPRYVVSWALDQTLEMPFVFDCVDRAFETALPDIFTSDKRSHFTSDSYLERLLSRNIPDQSGRQRASHGQYFHGSGDPSSWREVYLNEYD